MSRTLLRTFLLGLLLPPATFAAGNDVLVATIQSMPVFGNKAANYARFEQLTRQAAAAGAALVVTPEGYLDGYVGDPARTKREDMPRLAEPIDGDWLKKVTALARELRIHLIFGFAELRQGKVYNTAAVIAPDGSVIGRYSKTHLAGSDGPGGRELYEPGQELPVFDTKLGRIGILICFDRRFPENARVLALQGAQVMIVPAYGRFSTPIDEDILMQARAQENGIYVVYTSPHNAFAVDPEGAIISKVSTQNHDLMFAHLTVDGRLGKNKNLLERRPELYGRVLEKAPGAAK